MIDKYLLLTSLAILGNIYFERCSRKNLDKALVECEGMATESVLAYQSFVTMFRVFAVSYSIDAIVHIIKLLV